MKHEKVETAAKVEKEKEKKASVKATAEKPKVAKETPKEVTKPKV